MRTLKNILNTIFIFGAIIGMYLYYKGNDAGTIVSWWLWVSNL